MTKARSLFGPFGLSTLAITHFLQASPAPAENKKFSTLDVLGSWMTRRETELRRRGYSPENLYQSGAAYYADNQKLRAKMQLATMLRFAPEKDEVPFYEKSGDLLSEKGRPEQATKHWLHAFNYMHRPYSMNERLGHHLLIRDKLDQAAKVFSYQVTLAPHNPIAYNELGVTRFMQALKHNRFEQFEDHKIQAIDLFKKSSELDPKDRVALLNRKTAAILTIRPLYKSPARYLKMWGDKPTSMLDAIATDLEKNKEESRSAPGVGMTTSDDGKGGPTTIHPTFTSSVYQIPRIANEHALQDLAKLKAEDYESAHGVVAAGRGTTGLNL